MLFRLGSLRIAKLYPKDKMLSFRTLQIPKKIHHTLIKTSPFTSCSINYNKSIKNDELKQKSPINNNILANVLQKFRENPYVRISRLDRPIGEHLNFFLNLEINLNP